MDGAASDQKSQQNRMVSMGNIASFNLSRRNAYRVSTLSGERRFSLRRHPGAQFLTREHGSLDSRSVL